MYRKQPQVSWAQRKDSVYLTVEVVDPENVEVKLEDSQVSVSCKKDEIDYAIVLPLFASIKTEVRNNTPLYVIITFRILAGLLSVIS